MTEENITVIGFKGERAIVPKILLDNWLDANKKLEKTRSGYQKAINAGKALNKSAGFRVFTISENCHHKVGTVCSRCAEFPTI